MPSSAAAAAQASPQIAIKLDRRELAGALADVGVLVTISVQLIVSNGLSATAVLSPAGLLYVAVAWRYRLPVPVQPMKAFAAVALAHEVGPGELAAGALAIGAIFLALGSTSLLDRVARIVPRAVVRGIQLAVGVLFLKVAAGLVFSPPAAFTDHGADTLALLALTAAVAALAFAGRGRPVTVALLAVAVATMVARAPWPWELGPSAIEAPALSPSTFALALTVLVLPQLPLTFANSCIATADAAERYYGAAAARVRPSRLAQSIGAANLVAGSVGGMAVCHGAGGLTAHRAFGARSGGAPLMIGSALLVTGLVLGAGLGQLLAGFPLPILAGLLAVAAVLHIGLARDLRTAGDWALAVAVAAAGLAGHLALGVAAGTALWWLAVSARRRRGRAPGRTPAAARASTSVPGC